MRILQNFWKFRARVRMYLVLQKSNNRKRVFPVIFFSKTGKLWNEVKMAPHEPRNCPSMNPSFLDCWRYTWGVLVQGICLLCICYWNACIWRSCTYSYYDMYHVYEYSRQMCTPLGILSLQNRACMCNLDHSIKREGGRERMKYVYLLLWSHSFVLVLRHVPQSARQTWTVNCCTVWSFISNFRLVVVSYNPETKYDRSISLLYVNM